MRNHGVLWFVLATLLLAASACKDPKDIGLDVLPSGEQMGIAWIDTFTIEARTVRFDSVRTSNRSTYVVGDFHDPIFGRIRSQLYTQFKLNAEPGQFETSDMVDSVVLNLAYSGSYGRIDKLRGLQRFGVYEILEDLHEHADSVYYSSDTVSNVSAEPLAEIEFWPDLLNQVVIGSDTISPSFRVQLNSALGERIIASNNLTSNDVFSDEFKGLCIRPLNNQIPVDYGGLLYFNLEADISRLELFFRKDGDTIQERYDFDIDNRNAIFTNVYHEYSEEIKTAFNGGTNVGNQQLYVQSLAGTRIRVKFPHLKELNELGAVAINKAELVLPIDQTYKDDFPPPTILLANRINAGDSALAIIDQFEPDGINYYDGIYDSENNQYVFTITRHLQSIINERNEADYGLYISSLDAIDSRRAVFNGPKHITGDSLKLRMTYTIIE